MKKPFLFVLCNLALSACSQTVPVSGMVEKTRERFVGTATCDISGQGNLSVTTDNGVNCKSNFASPVVSNVMQGVSASGVLECSDGRKGNFAYSGNTYRGEGFGTLSDGNKFTFSYGSAINVKMQSF